MLGLLVDTGQGSNITTRSSICSRLWTGTVLDTEDSAGTETHKAPAFKEPTCWLPSGKECSWESFVGSLLQGGGGSVLEVGPVLIGSPLCQGLFSRYWARGWRGWNRSPGG